MGKRLYTLQKKKGRCSQKHNGPFTRTANPDIVTSFQPHICWKSGPGDEPRTCRYWLSSGRLRPGSKSFMIFMYSFQKVWLKTSTRDDFW